MPGPPEPKRILESCPNLFQLLELVQDLGPGVEKVVISQESFGRLLNLLQPGSYQAISKINLKSLDQLCIKPIGIYGDPVEIIMFLARVSYLDTNSAAPLSQAIKSSGPAAVLSSGLYLALDPHHQVHQSKSAYIIYWPEETTWQDQLAYSSVRSNRVTFMHNLTKLADQVIALVAAKQARGLNLAPHVPYYELEEVSDRHVPFEIQNQPDFNVTSSPGFTIPVGPYLSNGDESVEVRLVPGEEHVALMVVRRDTEKYEKTLEATELQEMIHNLSFQLGGVSPDDVAILGAHGLREKYKTAFETYDLRMQLLESDHNALKEIENEYAEQTLKQIKKVIIAEVHKIVEEIYSKVYPSLGSIEAPSLSGTEDYHQKYPILNDLLSSVQEASNPNHIQDEKFQTLKSRWLFVKSCFAAHPELSVTQRGECIDYIFNRLSDLEEMSSRVTLLPTNWNIEIPEETRQPPPEDPGFIEDLRSLESIYPQLSGIAQQIRLCLRHFITGLKLRIARDQVAQFLPLERERLMRDLRNESEHQLKEGGKNAFETLLRYLQRAMAITIASPRLRLESVAEITNRQHSDESARYCCTGYLRSTDSARHHHSIYSFDIIQSSPNRRVQLNKSMLRFEFTLEKDQSIEFIQLVHDKCVIVVAGKQWTNLYIDGSTRLSTDQPRVRLNHEALGGQQCIFALDQFTRLLGVVHGQKDDLKLSIYIFNELFTNLRSRGSPIPLKNWYDQPIDISTMCFVAGLEEVCLIETSGRVRIFSLVTQQFRTASLQIDRPIIDAFSAPDGSCLLVAVADEHTPTLHQLLTFHWASFGTNEQGINCASLVPCDGYRTASQLEGRGRVH
ncbi:unnamed protein product, partial [Rhizoctonia solani]